MQLLSPSETTSIPGTLIWDPPNPPNSPLRMRVRDVNNNIGRFQSCEARDGTHLCTLKNEKYFEEIIHEGQKANY